MSVRPRDGQDAVGLRINASLPDHAGEWVDLVVERVRPNLAPLVIILALAMLAGLAILLNGWGDPSARNGHYEGKTKEEIQADLDQDIADGQADVWLTPVTTDANPKAAGYDPAQDESYHAYDQIKLSQCGDGTQLEPTMDSYDRIWLSGLGGKMGGWSANDGSKKLLTQIHWTFAIAQQP